MHKILSSTAMLAVVWTSSAMAQAVVAPVQVEHAWARASVIGQQATGAFMQLTAHQPLRLVGVETPAAGFGEIHEMKMEGDVMRMRAMEGLDLPQGVPVRLKPGGYHLMFQQLKAPLQDGSQVPVTLLFQDAAGSKSQLQLQVPVRRMAPAANHTMPNAHGHSHGHTQRPAH